MFFNLIDRDGWRQLQRWTGRAWAGFALVAGFGVGLGLFTISIDFPFTETLLGYWSKRRKARGSPESERKPE